VDTKGFSSVTFATHFGGTIHTGTTYKIQARDLTGDSWEDVEAGFLIGAAAMPVINTVQVVGYTGGKRHVRSELTAGGTVLVGQAVILGEPGIAPVE
jgi:hypothetical protein